jgi:3-methyladenine DNA glycosylase AlkD
MIDAALAQLHAIADSDKAAEAAAYHKVPRPYLGISIPNLEPLIAGWRSEATLDQRIQLAADLWDTNIHEARVSAAKLLTQARIRPDTAVWDLICRWVPQFDAWALADHISIAGQKRLVADPARLDTVESWLTHDTMWVRRATLVMTLPWTKQNHPTDLDRTIRTRVLGWAATLAPERDWFIQKSIAWWLRELSKHDPDRARTFLENHGATLKSFARNEAAKYL